MDKDIAIYGSLNKKELGPSAVTRELVRSLSQLGCHITLYTTGDDTHDNAQTIKIKGSVDSVPNFVRTKRRVSEVVSKNNHDIFHSIPGLIDGADIQTCLGFASDLQMLMWAPQIIEPREFIGANVYSLLKLRGYHRTSSIVATSPMVKNQLRTYGRCSVDGIIPLGVRDEYRKAPDTVSSPIRILIPAKIGPIKGQHRILQYLDPDDDRYVVDIVGNIVDNEYAERISRWNHRMHGYSHDLEQYYYDADIVLVPSEHDNHPTTAVEAIGAGCSVIITNTCGFSTLPEVKSSMGVDIVESGREMLKTLEYLIDHPDKLERKKTSAYDLSEGMTWKSIAKSYLEYYEQL